MTRFRHALMIAAMFPATAPAQVLSDPMRPPAFGASGGSEQPSGPRLQSTLLSHGRRLAIIDGQTVALGGKVGDATLVDIAPTRVLLRRGAETETLPLLPAAEKKPSRQPAAASRMPGKDKK